MQNISPSIRIFGIFYLAWLYSLPIKKNANLSNFKKEDDMIKLSPHIKYLGINLPKETKELYTENYKTLMKEIKDDTNRWVYL